MWVCFLALYFIELCVDLKITMPVPKPTSHKVHWSVFDQLREENIQGVIRNTDFGSLNWIMAFKFMLSCVISTTCKTFQDPTELPAWRKLVEIVFAQRYWKVPRKQKTMFYHVDYLIVCIRRVSPPHHPHRWLEESAEALKRHRPAVLPEPAPLWPGCFPPAALPRRTPPGGECPTREKADKMCASWSSPSDASLFSQ